MNQARSEQVRKLSEAWANSPRWMGIKRNYSAEDVVRLRPSVHVEHSLARRAAEKFYNLLKNEPYIVAMGALNGSQAVQMVKGGLKSIYLSGWQVAADANLARQTYLDQSLYPSNSVPDLVKRLNNALMRADQIMPVKARKNVTGMYRSWQMPKQFSADQCMRSN